jgi:hypothetical protein
MGFIYISDGIDDALALHLNQYADAWSGVAGKGVPLNMVAVNDPINFAISARNLDPTNSRACQFLKADGTVLFQVDASGVKVSPDGTVASVPATLTATQTFTNKTFTNPVVGGAGAAAAGTLGFSGTVLQVGDGTLNAGINVGAWTAFTPTLNQGPAVAMTVNKAAYNKVGRQVTVFIQLTASAAGTAGNAITIGGIPAAIAAVTANGAASVGTAYLGFSPPRVGTVVFASSTQLQVQVDNNTGVAGVAPAVTLANAIVLSLTATWETVT